MKKFTLILFIVSISTGLWAQNWCGNSYLTVNGTWYTGSNSYVQPAGRFQGASLGSFTNLASITLGGELQVYPSTTNPASLYYRIDNGTITAISLSKTADVGNNSKHYGTGTISLGSVSSGSHTLEVYFQAGTVYDNNSGANFKASFTVSSSSITDPTACTAGISSTTATLAWTKSGSYNVMVVKCVKGVAAVVPSNGKAYALTDTVGTVGTVVFASGAGTGTTTTVLANTDYDFYFYSVNTNNYSAGVKVTASRDKFQFAYGVDGQSGWQFLIMTQNSNNPDQYEVMASLPTDISTLSCYVGWNSGGTGDPTWTNTGGGHSKTLLMNTLSNAQGGNAWIIISKSSSDDNWGANFPLNTDIQSLKFGYNIITGRGNIIVNSQNNSNVELFNVSGKIVMSTKVNHQINKQVPSGIYYVKIDNLMHKVIVQ